MTRFTLAALAVIAAQPVRAGVILQYQDDAKMGTTVELEGKKLRSLSHGDRDEGHSAIFDGDQHVFYALDDKDKSYRRMDEASANSLSDVMEKAKARMTPEQRAQMDAYLAKQQGAQTAAAAKQHTFTFEREAGSESVAGYTCQDYRVLRDGAPESEGCFVPWEAGVLKKTDFEALQEMGRFFEKTVGSLTGAGSGGGFAGGWVTRFVDTAPGFPAVMRRVDKDGKQTHEMRLVKIERTTLAASRFSPPADYREKPMSFGK
jgi:dsDNA-binding SOS-regulon protein